MKAKLADTEKERDATWDALMEIETTFPEPWFSVGTPPDFAKHIGKRLFDLKARVELAESKARDMQHTYEFGAKVINNLILKRTDDMRSPEFAFDALERWLKERDELKAKCEALEKRLVASADLAQFTADLTSENEKHFKERIAGLERDNSALMTSMNAASKFACEMEKSQAARIEALEKQLSEAETANALAVAKIDEQRRTYDFHLAERMQLQDRCKELEKALREIANHKFLSYESAEKGIYEGQYGIGVVDGHRACANIANAALSGGKEGA